MKHLVGIYVAIVVVMIAVALWLMHQVLKMSKLLT